MNGISQLTIQNVKGIDNKILDLDLLPNKPSILVAPNGFGKSSVACAFKSMNRQRIRLDPKHFHNRDETLIPSVAIDCTINGNRHSLRADGGTNTISQQFDVSVINSPLLAKATARGAGVSKSKGFCRGQG
jgi:hypothetical protein